MPWAAIAQHLAALAIYPGLGLILCVGLLSEVVAQLVGERSGPRGAVVAMARHLLGGLIRPGTEAGVALLGALAATQLAIPLNPLSPLERNVLLAAMALAAALWLSRASAWSSTDARVTFMVQACWLLAVLAPAILSETLRPQVLGAVTVRAQLPLKVLAGLLYLACLPLLLRPDTGKAEPPPARVFVWLPIGGLGVSIFFPPMPADVLGALRFLLITLAVAVIAAGLSATLRGGAAGRRGTVHLRLIGALAGVVLAVAMLTTALT
jgi:hypothetical protein